MSPAPAGVPVDRFVGIGFVRPLTLRPASGVCASVFSRPRPPPGLCAVGVFALGFDGRAVPAVRVELLEEAVRVAEARDPRPVLVEPEAGRRAAAFFFPRAAVFLPAAAFRAPLPPAPLRRPAVVLRAGAFFAISECVLEKLPARLTVKR